ncbi:fumarylacetoacetase [Roseateles sp. SL47]|uniref:fumarylacetoacetase n=1 Tax=Roseateles sp. SL47 TaxID=2995138 RepID=UPI00226F2681|nr:fumarylacetoacetase [Roseateles sp. SL47]WAC72715.1 fumarylacetoacetase [Roseateles sp. SL47]
MSSLSLDHTHDPSLRSWVASSNTNDTDFPIQNLPLAMARAAGSSEPFRPFTAIGDQALDLVAAADLGALPAEVADVLRACVGQGLNPLMAAGPTLRRRCRHALVAALVEGSEGGGPARLSAALVPQSTLEFTLPCRIGDYTDFYAGIHHATTVGKLFRPDNPLLPNYKWVPIGYHGRVSSLGVSGQQFRRPLGQMKAPDAEPPSFGPCKRLDYELEVGALVGQGNPQGQPVSIDQAEDHLFGLVLLNDWSARDIQAWEYQPLGPFLSKSFATTLSPWVVTMEALAPFRRSFSRTGDHPQPLPYLDGAVNREQGAVSIQLEVHLQTAAMCAAQVPPHRLMRSDFADCYWTFAQMLTHHASNGCNLQPGDLLGSGTQSGAQPDQGGSLLELTQGGKQPLTLPNGEQRTFLQDGDSVTLVGFCEAPGHRRIGFGPCVGTVLPAITG